MKNSVKNLKLVFLAMVTLFASCAKDEDDMTNEPKQTYATDVALTDAPIDQSNVSAAVVTITEVKVNGQMVEGFSATTVDLMTLQNGTTELLGKIDLEAQTDATVSLVLDYKNDVQGNAPGCYVETVDGVKHALEASNNEIKIQDKVEVFAATANKIIVDFDLRKTIIASANNSSDKFDFATENELESGLRLVNEMETGKVSGSVNDSSNTSEKIIAFAYEAGAYTDAEAQGTGSSNITFANAITSAEVNKSSSKFQLNFLKEGDYEVHFASYSDEDNDGEFEFNGMLEVESLTNINLGALKVTSNLNLDLQLSVVGFKE
ncbi:DUF4382 domain-containing protein [Galbibacter sp. BG1]|uniref:DUF4382 domain-containing protein n=1 Tax=Galbibacter sp. BG1 TaxID=1170699 RepID=UPI0015B9E48B|nr:DUF4382 domain-containing protein [Galbibacter sp. BG1]QLE00410.1 DUF4382 domain-containing protein [Galbibacter sp. BG1]